MKITFKDSEKYVRFGELHRGNVFIDPDYDEDTVMMCVDTCCDVFLTTDADVHDDTEYDGFAVNLNTGTVFGYDNDYKVIPIKAEVVVEK